MKKERVELHAYTNKSVLQGLSTIEEMVTKAEELNMKAIALTDNGGINDILNLQKLHGDVKIIHAIECCVEDNAITMLARNATGLKNIYKIISNADFVDKKINIDKARFEKYKEGLILGSSIYEGELYKAIETNRSEKELEKIVSKYDYLEIEGETVKKINKKIVELGEKTGKLVVAVGAVSYIDKNDYVFKEILDMGTNYKYSDKIVSNKHFKSTEEMLEEQSYLGKEKAYEVVVTNSNIIAGMCKEINREKVKILPYIEKSEEVIKTFSYDIAKTIYGKELPTAVKKRLDDELNVIMKNEYESIYIGIFGLVLKAKEEAYSVEVINYDFECSFVSFLLGLTKRCPLFTKESYEMFLNLFKGESIGLKVTEEYIDKAKEYLIDIYEECDCYGILEDEYVLFNDSWKYNKIYKEKYKDNMEAKLQDLAVITEKLRYVKKSEHGTEYKFIFVPKNEDVTDVSPVKCDENGKLAVTLMDIGVKLYIR